MVRIAKWGLIAVGGTVAALTAGYIALANMMIKEDARERKLVD